MKIAVSGASGFVGQHVLTALRDRGARAVAAMHTRPVTSSYHRVVSFDINAIDDPYDVFDAPDVLIHLAWSGLPDYGSSHHLDAELPAQRRMLTRLIESGLTRLLVAGTCFEYGLGEGVRCETDPAAPANPYAIAKDELRRFLEQQPVELTWARLFYLYGPGQAASSLYAQIAAGGRVDMTSGDQVRDFLPIEEAATLLVRLAIDHPGAGVVNVCSGRPVKVRDMAARWIRDNHWEVELNLGARPPSPFEPRAFWGDRGKLDSLLGATPGGARTLPP